MSPTELMDWAAQLAASAENSAPEVRVPPTTKLSRRATYMKSVASQL
jgi:hypothetical protein